MLANELLIDGFNRVEEVVKTVVTGLDTKELLYRPGPDANSIAWLVWHLARVEDDHIADVAGSEQLWHSMWHKQIQLPYELDSVGYGHSSEEVGKMQASADQLTGYYQAVHAQTVAYLQGLKAADYERIVDKRWDPPVTLAVRLISVLNDTTQHAGQAAYVRGILPTKK